MGKAKPKPDPERWTEKFGCDGRPPLKVVVEGIPDAETKARTVAKRNTNHCTLCRLHHLGHLKGENETRADADMRHKAAEKLQDDHALTGQTSIRSTLGSLGAGGSACGPAEIAQMRIDADRRKTAALRAVGTSGRFLLENIALNDWTLEMAAKILRTKRNAVLPALRVALDALVQHYGMNKVEHAKIRGGAAQPIHPFHPFQEGVDPA
jgi:hypothetical protein